MELWMIFDGKDPTIILTHRKCLGPGCIDGMVEDEDGNVTACSHCQTKKRISPKRRTLIDGFLSKPLKAAMYDIAEWENGGYCFKPKSMERLEVLKMVERMYVRCGFQCWRLSDKGRQWLADNPERK